MKVQFYAAAAICAVLAGCSSGGGQNRGLAASLYERLTTSPIPAAPEGESPGFTAALIAENPQNYMIANVPSVGLNAPARLLTRNGQRETWQAQNGATFAYDRGIMVATRGLIDDLLTTSSAGVREAIAAGGGSYQRGIETLDTQDQLVTSVVDCTMVSEGNETVNLGLRQVDLRKFTETCQNAAVSYQNGYWLDGQGKILQSRQFVSVKVGYVYANSL